MIADVHDTQPMRPMVAADDPTLPDLRALEEDDVLASVITRGHAQEALAQALAHLQAAHLRLEAVAMACARVVDLGAHP